MEDPFAAPPVVLCFVRLLLVPKLVGFEGLFLVGLPFGDSLACAAFFAAAAALPPSTAPMALRPLSLRFETVSLRVTGSELALRKRLLVLFGPLRGNAGLLPVWSARRRGDEWEAREAGDGERKKKYDTEGIASIGCSCEWSCLNEQRERQPWTNAERPRQRQRQRQRRSTIRSISRDDRFDHKERQRETILCF